MDLYVKRGASQRQSQEKGIYIVTVVLVTLFVFLVFLALVVGLGLAFSNRSRLINQSNLASLAAIRGFVQAPSNATYDQKEEAALASAEAIIAQNQKLPGVRLAIDRLGTSGTGEDGEMILGMWYPQPFEAGGSDPCTGANDPCNGASNYPCFVANASNTCPVAGQQRTANAARVILRTDSYVPPFGVFLGQDRLSLGAASTATLVQRCTAYLIDISLSAIEETHNVFPGLPLPPDATHFSFGLDEIRAGSPPESWWWNNMGASRPIGVTADPLIHYQSDYPDPTLAPDSMDPSTPYYSQKYGGPLLIDNFFEGWGGYIGPQPLTTFLLAFNVGLRNVEAVRSPGDKAMIYAFTSQEIDRYPPVITATGAPQLTEDLGFLIQLTHFPNRGLRDAAGNPVYPVKHPNFIDRGWFPIWPSDGNTVLLQSNHVLAMLDAINALSLCPPTASKSIIMASDGVPSCAYSNYPNGPTDCSLTGGYPYYLQAESTLLDSVNGVLKDLKQRDISVTTLLTSANVGPGIKVFDKGNGKYIVSDEAYADGSCDCGIDYTDMNGTLQSCSRPCFDNSPIIPVGSVVGPTQYDRDRFAYDNYNGTDTIFRRPNGLWGHLALKTGGVVCPIVSRCYETPGISCNTDTTLPAGTDQKFCYYDHDNNPNTPRVLNSSFLGTLPNSSDGVGKTLNCSYFDLSRIDQAVACVLGVVGGSPFHNVEEVR